jgi:hypothetical protein
VRLQRAQLQSGLLALWQSRPAVRPLKAQRARLWWGQAVPVPMALPRSVLVATQAALRQLRSGWGLLVLRLSPPAVLPAGP